VITGHLLLFAALVTAAVPGILQRARWVYRSPLLGIIAWYATLSAVVSAVAAATVSLLLPWRRNEAPVCTLWRWCWEAARGEHGTLEQVAAAAVVGVAAVSVIRLLVCAARFVRIRRAQRREHLQLLRLVGREVPELGATVIESPQPAAYMVAGHHRHVVVTTGAIASLRGEELDAVLAHERAHASGRHDVLLNGVRLLHTAFPLSLFGTAWQQLVRLVEMRADEVAVTHHRPISLARALVAMADASAADVPAGAVAATGGDALARLGRLLEPPDRLTIIQKATVSAGVVAMVATPAVTLAMSWLYPSLSLCAFLPL
jgi:Zn-dependent protease with chaperone function